MRKSIVLSSEIMIGEGRWLNLCGFNTASGYREIAMRKNGHYMAAKCLVLYTDLKFWEKLHVDSSSDLRTFLQNLRNLGLDNLQIFFLASDKPCTYLKSPDLEKLSTNYMLEIPGGVADAIGENNFANGLRELCEEYGCTAADIAMTAPLLVDIYAANDAGGQVEFYSTCVALVTKKPKPLKKEGVIPKNCTLIPLLEAEDFLLKQGKQGVLLEWISLASLFHLGLALHGGWASLGQRR